ncbi:MAG: DUF167 domain-containing protein [Gaiellaceae bacterium]
MGGTRLRVRVMPGSAAPAVVGRHGQAWKLRVREAPERGRANEALRDLLANTLALPKGSVRLVAGHSARDKIVELAGITAEETDCRLAAAEQKGSR